MKRNLPATPFFTSNGVPTRPFQRLLELTGIVEADFASIVDLTKRHWRVQGKTPAEIVEKDAHLLEEALPLLKDLRVVGAPKIQAGDRQWTIILGATYVGMHKRIAYAVDLWKNHGVRWPNTAYLTSARKRFTVPPKDQERDDVIVNPVEGGLPFVPHWRRPEIPPATESELVQHILWQVGSQRTWNTARERFVRHDSENANTMDTLKAFADQCDPQGDACLVISSQPHILRQGMMAARVLGDRFQRYDFAGYDTPAAVNLTKTLDDIAKFLYDLSENPA